VLNKFGRGKPNRSTIEIISVGGKGLFKAYEKLLTACLVPYSIIADLDYIEEIGSEDIKGLFALDESEIKKDVIDSIKSIDGKMLVARIDKAIATGSWGDATSTWEYIKSRRKKLRTDLNSSEHEALNKFILGKRAERIYLLKEGALEDYLPEGYRDKDLDKLITLIADPDFWSKISNEAREEVSEIVQLLLHDPVEGVQPIRSSVPWYKRRIIRDAEKKC
jgi:putative ATP-dependent endonuclease of OLD family